MNEHRAGRPALPGCDNQGQRAADGRHNPYHNPYHEPYPEPYHEGDPRMASAVPTPPAMDRPHFIGIGGAGMSGIAKILAQRGARVAGSDARESGTAAALRR